ncbi:MAG: hypothetical protein EBQ94_00185 [Flavobacteriales bacterium]|nr:hypothetical protein [Flavobacteriales bacterium]
MPLPNIRNHQSLQCKAKAKHTGVQCQNPAAFGLTVCRFHGARRPASILRGANHPNFQHGQETLQAKAKRSAGLTKLRRIEELMLSTELFDLKRSPGRKPSGYK